MLIGILWEDFMRLKTWLLGAACLGSFAGVAGAETLTIATVNNGDMIRMQGLSNRISIWNG